MKYYLILFLTLILIVQCKKEKNISKNEINIELMEVFGEEIDLNHLANYSNLQLPSYIKKNNDIGGIISDAKATLGRVLFYDKKLSVNNTTSCGNCHIQKFAFGDTAIASTGLNNKKTNRHSMRLFNVKYAAVKSFFWDRRAATLEEQTTMPIKDEIEMGYSGQNGNPSFNDLINKLDSLKYYNVLFNFVYGDNKISEIRIQECLTHFIRSINSFDSKFDIERAKVDKDLDDFVNFTPSENLGKKLFLTNPLIDGNGMRVNGGLGCNRCHNSPEFDIQPASLNNGVISKLSGTGFDFKVTKSPSLRNLTNYLGKVNTPMMHNGAFKTIDAVLNHYGNYVPPQNIQNIDGRILNNGNGTKLNITNIEKQALIDFINTLSGSNLYVDRKWSNPFK